MCPHEEKITAWLLGDQPPSAQDEMTRHLERCAACRAARDELEGVLVPLRHGLERDRRRTVPQAAPAARRGALRAGAPFQRGLRRAALFALSFGGVFLLFSALRMQREERGGGVVTRMTFQRQNDVPPPVLSPLPPRAVERAEPLADFKPELPTEAARGERRVAQPPLPADAPGMPRLPVLMKAREPAVAEQKKGVPYAEAPGEKPARNGEAATKSEMADDGGRKQLRLSDPPSSLTAKPVALGGAVPARVAPTNAPARVAPTNAPAATNAPALTNAPAVRNGPR